MQARDRHVIVVIDHCLMWRWLAWTAVMVITLTSLSACYLGPDPVQYGALAVIDGQPTAVVAACGRPNVIVVVYLHDKTTVAEYHRWAVSVTLPSKVRDVEVELFGQPRPGWEILPVNAGQVVGTRPGSYKNVLLTSIEAGHSYTLDSSTGGPEGTTAPVITFTTDDLSKIGAGQVLVPVDYHRSKVTSRESFVDERCG